MMNNVPVEVQAFLHMYVSELKSTLPHDQVIGVYVYGSTALGAFHLETSDIDFVTVTKEELKKDEEENICALHKRLCEHGLGKRMDGMYIPLAHVGQKNEEMAAYQYCADGKIHKGYWDVNAVTWWTLKHHGITVTGRDVSQLSLQVGWNDVVETMKYNIEQYWSKKAASPYLFFTDEWVESAVVTMGRILYTLENGGIVSKDAGLTYMMKSSPKWEPLLQEVKRIRTGKGERVMTRWSRMKMTRQYLLEGIEVCTNKWLLQDSR